ncbi:MAG TPA: arsenate reductase ArsC, partial [Polyangiaceae bacterium]
MNRRKRVLFLCTGNSARSQMAEALMRQLAGDRYEVMSAGTHPKAAVHPEALKTLEKRHTPSAGLAPKDVSTFTGQSFDYVITVCDRAQEECPVFPGADMIHWSFPDPADAEPGAQARAFNAVYQGLAQRIRLLMVVSER